MMKRPRMFELTLQHDNGQIKIRTSATSIRAAYTQVCKAENCPESAVLYWRVIPTKKQIRQTQQWLSTM